MSASKETSWTKEEDERIVRLAKEGRGTDVMSTLIGRSIGAIESRITYLRSIGIDVPKRVGGRKRL